MGTADWPMPDWMAQRHKRRLKHVEAQRSLLRDQIREVMVEKDKRLRSLLAMPVEEYKAGVLLADILGAGYDDIEPRDPGGGGGPGIHDFDLLCDGHRIAVEVTQDASAADRAFQSNADRRFPVSSPVAWNWRFGVSPIWSDPDDQESWADCSHLAKRLPAILEEAEAKGVLGEIEQISRHHPITSTGPGAVLTEELRSLGITKAWAWPSDGDEAEIRIGLTSFSGFVGASGIPEAVTRHVEGRADNREKLGRAKSAEDRPADEAHLFIWLPIDQPLRHGPAGAAMSELITPDEMPALDRGAIDVVWAVPYSESTSKTGRPLTTVRRLDRDGHWKRYGCVWREQDEAALASGLTD